MNCPNCGAENEAGVRFCIECGTPLEDQTILGSPASDDEANDDQTILTTAPRVAEDAKTVSVTQEEVAAPLEVEVEPPPSPPSPEPEAPQPAMPPPSPPPPPAGGDSGGKSNRNIIIIVVVVLLVLCCCCATLAVFGAASTDVMEDIMYELSFLPQPFMIV